MPSLTRVISVTENRVVQEQRPDDDIIGTSSSSVGMEVRNAASTAVAVSASSSSSSHHHPTVATAMGVHSTQIFPPDCTPKTLLPAETQKTPSSTSTPTYRERYTNKLLQLTKNEIASEGRYLRHEGRGYRRSSNKNGVTKYRCFHYLSGGSQGTAGAKWCTFQVAKRRNPCAPPHRCSGVLSVNNTTKEKIITIAHECTPLSAAESMTGIEVKEKYERLRYQGRVYVCTGIKDSVSRYRCGKFLPAGAVLGTADAIWSSYPTAKARSPGQAPYRCPGVLVVNRKTEENTIAIAHECTHYKNCANKAKITGERVSASKGGYLRHDGGVYGRCSSKDGVSKYRCFQYLPGGTVGTDDAVWSNFDIAKKKNPDSDPIRCPGILVVNQNTNEETITVAHVCKHASNSDSTSGREGVGKTITARKNASKGGYLRYNGGVYTRSTTRDDVSRYRCFQYRPGGSGFAASGCWSFFNKAKSGNPDATPHRCPGVLNVNNKTNEYTITVAHECMLASTTESVKDGRKDAVISNRTELPHVSSSDDKKTSPGASKIPLGYPTDVLTLNQTNASNIANFDTELKNIDLLVPEQIVFGEVLLQGHPPEASPNGTQVASLSGNMDADGRDAAIDDSSLDDKDDNSVSSNKDFYKDLCARLTAALNKRKTTEKVAREENKRLKKELKRLKDRISE